jgi:enterochelin esterase family protein
LQNKLDNFWQSQKSLPLVEKDSLYDDYLYVTFIHRDSTKNSLVSFDIFGNYDDKNLGNKMLKRLRNTDLYYRSYYMPNDICFSYHFIITDTVNKRTKIITDKHNPERIPSGPLKDYSWSVLDLDQIANPPYIKRHDNIKSELVELTFKSTILKNTRKIFVYLPENYSDKREEAYPVIYLFDSFIYLNRIEVPNVLDNMIYENEIEPMVAVFIDNATNLSRDKELPLNFEFKDFVINELVPYINNSFKITDDPQKTIIGGMSYGGLAASFISFYHSDIFGKVISQSGSFWRDTTIEEPAINWYRTDWLINKFQTEDKKNLKIYMDWGLQEPIILNSNRKFVRVLNELRYDFNYSEFNGWHDWSNSRKSFPTGLKYLMENQ